MFFKCFFLVLHYHLFLSMFLLSVSSLDIALHVKQYYTGEDASTLRFMDSVADRQD